MRITLKLHQRPPESPPQASRTIHSKAEAARFLGEALDRIAAGIEPGESRAVGITVHIEGG